jgi:uncharacterized membrane protein
MAGMQSHTAIRPRRLTRALDGVRAVALSPVGIAFVTALCLVVADLRRFAEVEPGYGFLRWNLFLAWVPLLLAYAISLAARRRVAWPALPVLAVAWIVFLPNAPYLVTDLVHLREGVSLPNVVALSLLATTGLLIGVKSVQLVQRAIDRLFGALAARRAVQAVAALVAFGVYVGRVLRWNSWTLILHPHDLARALLASPSEPGRVGFALLGTLAFAVAFYVSYLVLAGSSGDSARLSPDRATRLTRS